MSRADRNRKMAAEIAEKIRLAKEKSSQISFAGRLEVLRKGMDHYTRRDAAKASQEYRRYLTALEFWKKAPEGKLVPKHFDLNLEKSEVLLVAGIYWDLMKLFDKLKSEKRRSEFLHYTQKFIQFTKGMPFEKVAAENVRKYLRSGKANNVTEFKSTYAELGGSNCFVATSLAGFLDEETIPSLRHFRSHRLEKTRVGLAVSNWYGKNGLALSFWMDRMPLWFRRACARVISRFGRVVSSKSCRCDRDRS